MKAKPLILAALALVVGLLIAGCTASAPPAAKSSESKGSTEPIVLQMVSFLAVNHPSNVAVKMYSDIVKEMSGGRMSIKLIGGPEVFPQQEVGEAMRKGVLDSGYVAEGYIAQLWPESGAIAYSELAPLEERKSEGGSGFYDLLLESSKAKGLYYLGRASMYRQSWALTKTPVTKRDDLKQLTFGTTAVNAAAVKGWGAKGVVMQGGDVYSALDRGLVNATFPTMGNVLQQKWNEVAKYLLDVPVRPGSNTMFVMSLKKFESLPKDMQDVLVKASIAYERQADNYWELDLYKSRESVLKAGVQFTKMSPDDATWTTRTFVESLWESVLKNTPDYGKKLFDVSRKATAPSKK